MITTPTLNRGDLADATERALSLCPDLHCPRAVVNALCDANLSVFAIGGRALGDAIEAERERRRRSDTFISLGDATAKVVAEIERKEA